MNPPESLLQAAHRDVDPTAALACADWYDEHDQPEQARLMRLSVRLEQLGPGHPDSLAIELEVEKLRLWLEWERRLNGDNLAKLRGNLLYAQVRGLPLYVHGDDPWWWADAVSRWFAQSPVRGLAAYSPRAWRLGNLLRSLIGPRLIGLDLMTRSGESAACFQELNQAAGRVTFIDFGIDLRNDPENRVTERMPWEFLASVRRLRWSDNRDSRAVLTGLGQSKATHALQEVNISGGSHDSPTEWTQLQLAIWGNPEHGRRIRSWTASGYDYSQAAMATFTHPDFWPDLDSLSIHVDSLNQGAVIPLATLVNRGTLRSLKLSGIANGFRRGDIDLFSAADTIPGIRRLDWAEPAAATQNWASLAAWPGLATVTDLSLGTGQSSPAQLDAWLQSPYLGSLQRLVIRDSLDVRGVEILLAAIADGCVESLSIHVNPWPSMGGPRLIRLLAAKAFSRLRSLEISGFFLDAYGPTFLDHVDMPALECLRIDFAFLDAGIARSILESPRLPRLAFVALHQRRDQSSLDLGELPAGWCQLRHLSFIHPERLR